MRRKLLLALIVTLLFSAGCRAATTPMPAPTAALTAVPTTQAVVVESAAAAPALETHALTENPWQWVSFTGPVEAFNVEMPASYTLTFNEDGTVNVVADCNNASGSYAADIGSLTIEIGPMTRAVCPPESRSDRFIELLRGAAIAFFENGNLHIDLAADGGTLTFSPANTAATLGIPAESFAGTYHFRPTGEEKADYFLMLNADSTAEIDERPIGSTDPADVKADAIGTWTADGATVLFEASEWDGEPVAAGEYIVRIEFENGFPLITEIKVGDYFSHLGSAHFSIGAGEQGPLVREVQERLAGIDYLAFTDPGTDVYDEQTRQAVVAFQRSQGLHPNGVVDEETWRLLFRGPQTPMPTPTPLESAPPPDEAPTAGQLTATTNESVNLRSGPGTQYVLLATVDPGTEFEVTGRNAEATWVQIAYPDGSSRAWVSGDYVTVSEELAAAPVVAPETQAEEAPETEATTAPAAAAGSLGTPNLDNLPTHTEDGQPIVYFTFDDGPQPNTTDTLADLFEQYGGTATYFMVGKNVLAHPELVRYATTKGHYIADHTWDHGDLSGMTREQFVDEVERTREAILQVAGDLFNLDRDVRYVRPPYASTDANTRQYAANLGMAVVMWTIDPQDWRRPGADVVANHILSHVQPGSIVLSHDGGGDRSQTIEAYRTVLPDLAAQGYVFRNIFTP